MIPTDKLPTPPKFVQSVPDLSHVESLLTALVLLACVCVIAIIVNKLLGPTDDAFKVRLNELIYLDERSQVESLLDKANEILALHDSQCLATYYKGRALYRLDRHEEAYAVFTKLKVLDPSWSENCADPYLNTIRGKLGQTQL